MSFFYTEYLIYFWAQFVLFVKELLTGTSFLYNYYWINQFSNIHDYFFIQAVVPSSNMLQTGEAQKSNENILDAFIHSQINALSFSRSQKVLGWSKFFVPDQKFIYVYCDSHKHFVQDKKMICIQ